MKAFDMTRTPVADWQRLSELYEVADALEPDALDEWLARLQQQAHPMLPQLRQMLEARSQNRDNGFLDELPYIPTTPAAQVIEWHGGNRIGPYRLDRKIGSGGMADVWLAHRDDGAFERQVAIKLLFRDAGSKQQDTFAQRFDRERDILASLNHPHIAGLHDAGVTPSGQPWLALEYVEGEMLTTWCDTHRLGIEARVRLFRQALLAVQHAHANLVIHRDLKPGNILVTSGGGVRLLDFGIAKLMEPEGAASVESELTRMAGRPMTPQYAAPEQLLGQPLTTSCDVYALGVVLYELLCGERPYELMVESAAQLEQAILDVEPRAPSRRTLAEPTAIARSTTSVTLRRQLGSDLDAIVLRALAKQPAQRYGSVEALGADLDRWLGGEPVEARAPSTVYRIGKFVRRHTLSVSLGVGAVVSLVCVTAVAVVMGLQAREESARAVAARDFMQGIFARADQEKSRGADITARDLLEAGRKDVSTRLAGQPKLQAEALKGIAKIQSDMGEYATADSSYAELTQIYLALGQSREAAFTLADHAENAIQTSNSVLAKYRLEQAEALYGRPRNDAELNARLDGVRGWIALSRGDAAGARTVLLSSRQSALAYLGETNLQTYRLGLALFKAESDLFQFDRALALHESLRKVADKVAGLGLTEPTGLDTTIVEMFYSVGRYAQALKIVEAASVDCESRHGIENQYCRSLSIKKWQTLQRLGFVDRALAEEHRMAVLANDTTAPVVQMSALLVQFRLRSASRDAVGLDALRERVRALGESGAELAVQPKFKVAALLTLAEASLRDPRSEHAQHWIDAATSLLDKRPLPRKTELFDAVRQALYGVTLVRNAQLEKGLNELQKSQSLFMTAIGSEHPLTRLNALNVAVALEALGRVSEARALVDAHDAGLQDALGRDAPAYLKIMRLKERLAPPKPPAGTGVALSEDSARQTRAVAVFDFFS